MKLKVINTGSVGNAYLLYNEQEVLLIECGVSLKEIKQSLNYDLTKVVGCITTHLHGDHSKCMLELLNSCVEVYSSKGTFKGLELDKHHNSKVVKHMELFTVGNFKIIPFNVKHDAPEPLGFLIHHKDCGLTLFLTDTFYSPYKFKGLNNIIIEANFCEEIIREKDSNQFLTNRILKSHLSIQKCIDLLNANDLTEVNNIVLIHLSDRNSNEKEFKEKVIKATCKNTFVAHKGLEIEFNKTPF